ncbi:Protoporphyrinogen oxidase [Penicillium griseofulvum]|uniref:Protoporphyrinogen oxidase n=1 Tax=Penicillium patulum TaxID=5078 RepID=A0A135LGA5_PENPA|nr:Protoporphyrinogen oxidase [Penicillium griseofulvum]KXG47996.1 Protoporphyrinogen oxidase [Penicillium griseofulvum]
MRLPCVSKALRARKGQLNILNGQRRTYVAAVLGGGITGLTSAWQLAQDPMCRQINLFEKTDRLGGWIDSEIVPVDGGNIVFEYGPRTLKSSLPGSLPLLYLATNLGLYKDLIVTPKTSPAAQNRYIYYPDRLVRLPAPKPELSFRENVESFVNTMQEPLFNKFLSGIAKDVFAPSRHPTEWAEDESVTEFIGRRFGANVADNLVSAAYHGIYAGDIDRLSAQTLLGSIRNLEGGIGGIGGFVSGGVTASLISRSISKTKTRNMDDFMAIDVIPAGPELVRRQHDLEVLAAGASTFTFKRGVSQLVEALIASLKATGKVNFRMNTEIKALSQSELGSHNIEMEYWSPRHAAFKTFDYQYVISTIPPVALANVMRKTSAKHATPGDLTPSLLRKQDYAVTAMVVNLYYTNPDILPVEDGFGYLIPRSIPYEQNPECGLGVIFASSSSVGNGTDPESSEVNQDSAPGTKLTVMLGGHYWDGFDEYPDHDTAVKMARDMLKRHLNITDTPAATRSRLQKDAIPQYTVGHLDRMYKLSDTVRKEYNNRLILAGNWYNGIGVGECVKQGILSATYGIGRNRLNDQPSPWRPWTSMNYDRWELKGGVVMSPVRLVDSEV